MFCVGWSQFAISSCLCCLKKWWCDKYRHFRQVQKDNEKNAAPYRKCAALSYLIWDTAHNCVQLFFPLNLPLNCRIPASELVIGQCSLCVLPPAPKVSARGLHLITSQQCLFATEAVAGSEPTKQRVTLDATRATKDNTCHASPWCACVTAFRNFLRIEEQEVACTRSSSWHNWLIPHICDSFTWRSWAHWVPSFPTSHRWKTSSLSILSYDGSFCKHFHILVGLVLVNRWKACVLFFFHLIEFFYCNFFDTTDAHCCTVLQSIEWIRVIVVACANVQITSTKRAENKQNRWTKKKKGKGRIQFIN